MSTIPQDYIIERHAGAVIDDPANFDAIEVQGVRAEQTGPDSFIYEGDNTNPEAYSVYVHAVAGGVQCVGDFTRRDHAQDYAKELSAAYSWPIHDYTHDLPLAA